MNVKLQPAHNDKENRDTAMLDHHVDIPTVRGKTLIDLREMDITIHDDTEVENRFRNHLRLAEKAAISEKEISCVIEINRTEPFDPVQFMNDPRLTIAEEDERTLMLGGIDLSDVSLVSMVREDTVIRGEEHLKRSKETGHIRLDAKIFQTLWENQYLIPEQWKGTDEHPKHIFFDGTVLQNHCGRFVIALYWGNTSWDTEKKWRWTYCRLDIGGWRAEDV